MQLSAGDLLVEASLGSASRRASQSACSGECGLRGVIRSQLLVQGSCSRPGVGCALC